MLKIDTESEKNRFGGTILDISAEWLTATKSMFESMNEANPKEAKKFAEIIEEYVHSCFLTGEEKEEFEKECKDTIEKAAKFKELDDLIGKILKLIEED